MTKSAKIFDFQDVKTESFDSLGKSLIFGTAKFYKFWQLAKIYFCRVKNPFDF